MHVLGQASMVMGKGEGILIRDRCRRCVMNSSNIEHSYLLREEDRGGPC